MRWHEEIAGSDPRRARTGLLRWLPLLTAVAAIAAILLHAGTPVAEIARYLAYAIGVVLPGTLVYRALRGPAHTLVEDVAMGAAVGLVLELAAWACLSTLDIRSFAWLWPLAAVALFLLPPLRRHFVVRPPQRTPLAWSWTLCAIVVGWTAYLAAVFLDRNPLVPPDENTRQYLDLAYQLSLAGEARNHIPLHVPQVAGEPLYYPWFAYAHMAMANMVAGVDLTAVSLRFAVPALCALGIVLTAVVGWRISGRPWAGIAAAALFFTIGEVNFTHPVTMPFGTQAAFVVWHGMSMIYSWVLLLALILALARILVAPARGWWILTALLLFASSGAKASSLPVVLGALCFTALVLLIFRRRIPWRVVGLIGMALAAQLFAIAALYRFRTYNTGVNPLGSLEVFGSGWALIAVFAAFVMNMQLRQAGIIPLLWYRLHARHRPTRPPEHGVEALLVGGALAGVGAYLMLKQLSDGQQYFARAGFAFGVLASGWGYAEVFERAQLTRRGRVNLGVFAAVVALAAILVELLFARPGAGEAAYAPILRWSLLIAVCCLVGGVAWRLVGKRGTGGLVLLTAILVLGAPGLVMDAYKSVQNPNGGAYYSVPMPRSHVLAARWVRDHSSPGDVLATDVHCQPVTYFDGCDPRSFWLSAYAERRVLVEGWTFAPRVAGAAEVPFWDPDLLRRNDEAIADPTAQRLAELRDRYGVRWIVADDPSPRLAEVADLRYRIGSTGVYQIRPSEQ
jgi:hypothetical protein